LEHPAKSLLMPNKSPLHQSLLIIRHKFNVWFVFGALTLTAGILLEVYLLAGPPIDIHDKAALGELINGLTAPLIGIVGAILIYISFKEQVKSNRFQFQALHEQREWELLYRLYEELKDDLRNLQLYYGPRHNQHDILHEFMNAVLKDDRAVSPYPDVSQYLDYIFKQFSFLSLRISQNDVLGKSEKVHLIEKTRQLFNLYFEAYYSRIVNHDEWTSRFSLSFCKNMETGGKAVIDLNAISMSILKEKYRQTKRA
jgi:hypothetical protein